MARKDYKSHQCRGNGVCFRVLVERMPRLPTLLRVARCKFWAYVYYTWRLLVSYHLTLVKRHFMVCLQRAA